MPRNARVSERGYQPSGYVQLALGASALSGLLLGGLLFRGHFVAAGVVVIVLLAVLAFCGIRVRQGK